MISRSTLGAMMGGLALGAGLAVAASSAGQEDQPRTVLIQQPNTAPAVPPPAGPGAPPPKAGGPMDLHITALSTDTFVTVKDHGDSQTVTVFKLDAKGQNHLSHKAKFFY